MLSSTSADSNAALASLLATATLALDTDRRAAKTCIQRAAALLGIDLSSGGNGAAERSCVQGGLAPWQAKRLRSYIEERLDSRIRASDLAGIVQLSTSHFIRAFRRIVGTNPRAWRRQLPVGAAPDRSADAEALLNSQRANIHHPQR
jgi:AraC family transcriptional regulator